MLRPPPRSAMGRGRGPDPSRPKADASRPKAGASRPKADACAFCRTSPRAAAAAAERFVVIVSSDKVVERLAPPVPVELLSFGLTATLLELGTATLRAAPQSPDRGIIADYGGPVEDPAALAAWLDAVPGVVGH